MGSIAVLSARPIADELRRRGVEVIECRDGSTLDAELRAGIATLEAIIVGNEVRDPIQTAQRAYRLDPAVTVVLLGSGEQCAQLRGALRFAPFIGNDVECRDHTGDDVVGRIASAAERTRARRNHRLRLGAVNAGIARAKPMPAAPPREQFLAQLVDTAPIGIVALDAAGLVLSVNHEASRLLASSERDALGRAFDAGALGATEEAWRVLLANGENGRAEATFEREAGPVVEVRLAALTGPTGSGYLVVVQDITERARAAQVHEAAARRAEEASRLKDEFIAMVSHELRTPMNAIVGWSRMIRAGQVPPARLPHAFDVIERNATAQAKLIEDLLDVSRIIGGKMRLEVRPTSIRSVIEQASDAVRIAAAARGVSLVVDVADDVPEVFADADRLRQVVWNLLSNAVKFGRRSDTVRITARRSGSTVVLAVVDEGDGIASEALPYIFDPFRQAEGGTTRQHGGLGLGLAIARRLVELHGGTLTAASAGRGRGATLTITLPISAIALTGDVEDVATSVRDAVAASSVSGALTGVRVLVVDDDDDTRELVEAVLATAGGLVTQAHSTAAAIRELARARFDVLVSDIGMPDADGYALVQHLRAHERATHRRLPVLALTAYATADDAGRALRAGFDAHAPKPIDPVSLVVLTAGLVASARGPRG